jgi:carbon-monoxide dehydrogenase medium subunit
MKPPPFDYYRPNTVGEALELLARFAGDASILAGGQSLVPMMNMRLAEPPVLIDINRIQQLTGILKEADGFVVGAMTRQRAIEESAVLRDGQPLLLEAVSHIGHVMVRNRGTIGGSLAHADPAAELGVVALALGVEVVVQSSKGKRVIPADQFFFGPFMTARGDDEMITEVRIPARASGSGWAFLELARTYGNFAVAAACAIVELTDGTISNVRLALGGVAPTPVRAAEAESLLEGKSPGGGGFREVAEAVDATIQPTDDAQATAEYRRSVTKVLAGRALQVAAERAGGDGSR